MFLEAAIKVPQRVEPAVVCALEDGLLGVFHKVTGTAEAIVGYVGGKGNTDGLLEMAGQIGIIVAEPSGQFGKGTVAVEMILHKRKNFVKQLFVVGVFFHVLRRSVELPAQGI